MSERARRLWASPDLAWARALLVPVELAYRAGVAARALGFDLGALRARRGPIPVISVGNLTVGGTGKTPVVAWLARTLAERGERPAIVSRGYGDDEIALHRRWHPEVPVVASVDRLEGVRRAAADGARVAVLDDGFQHRWLKREADIVLIAAEQPFPGALLPRGPYREPMSALDRADMVIVTRKTASPDAAARRVATLAAARPGLPVATLWLSPSGWLDLEGRPASPPPEGGVLVVASVAFPQTVVDLVAEQTGTAPELLAFPDHHPYGRADVLEVRRRAGGRPIVTTEKDAVKLAAYADTLGDVRVLRLSVAPGAGVDKLDRVLDLAVGQAAGA